jgi:hypothetical protein
MFTAQPLPLQLGRYLLAGEIGQERNEAIVA